MSATLQPGDGRRSRAAGLPAVDARRPCCGAACRARPTRPSCASRPAPRSRSTPSATRACSTTRAATRSPSSRATASRRGDVLDDAIEIAATPDARPADDGPHVVTGPILVEGAMPGDLLAITVLETHARACPYGVISNRHGRARCAASCRAATGDVSVFTPVESSATGTSAACRSSRAASASIAFPLAPFLGIMGVAVGGRRAAALGAARRARRQHRHQPARRWAPRCTCRCRCRARSRTSATRTSRRATARSRSPRWRRRCASTLRFDVVPRGGGARRVRRARRAAGARRPSTWCRPGCDPDLDEAMRKCVRAAIALLAGALGPGRAPRLRVPVAPRPTSTSRRWSTMVCGVHARIRDGRLRRGEHDADERPGRAPAMRAFDGLRARDPATTTSTALDDLRSRPGPADDARRRRRPARRARRDQRVPQRPRRRRRPACSTASRHRAARRRLLADRRDLALRRRRHRAADAGVAAHRRALAHHRGARDRRARRLRPVGVAHGRRPALPGRVRGSARRACASPSRTCSRSRATGSARATRRGSRGARRERQHAPAVLDLLRGGASVRGIARTDEFAYSHRRRQRALRHPAQRRRCRARCPAARRAGRPPPSPPARPTSASPPTPPARSACPASLPGPVGAAHDARARARGRACCRSRRRSTRSAG